MFEIKYELPYGHVIYKDGQRWDGFYYKDVWEAIDTLMQTHPNEAKELYRLERSVD